MKRLYKIYLIIFISLLTGAPASANEVTAILPYPWLSCSKKHITFILFPNPYQQGKSKFWDYHVPCGENGQIARISCTKWFIRK